MQDQVIEVTARSSDGWRPCERPSSPSRRHFLRRAAAIGCTTLLGRRMARAVAPTPNRQDRSLVVWFAHNICTATDAGKVLDEASVGGIFERCVDLGFNTVYWDPRYVGPALYHSKVVAPFDKRPWIEGVPGFSVTPTHARHAQAMADLLARFDPYDVAVREAERHGVKFIAQTRIFDRWFPILKDRFYEEHPECLMLDRSGKFPLWGIPCYAEPGTRDYCLAEIRELIERGAAGVSLALESHQIRYWPSELGAWRPDSFGFNPPVVEQYQRRHGVNVLKEAPEPAKWHELHGDLFTEFLRLVKKELGEKLLIVGAHPEGFVGYGGNAVDVQHPDYQAPPTGFAGQQPACRINLQWRKWLQEGIVDAVRVYAESPYNVASVEAMKRQMEAGRFYFARWVPGPERLADCREQVGRVPDSILDGFVLHEDCYFDYEPQRLEVLGDL